MSGYNLLDQIKRIKYTTKPVSKRAKEQQQTISLQKALTEAHLLNSKLKKTTKDNSFSDSLNFDCQSKPIQKMYSYKGKSFYFPVKDIQLSVKRVQVFSDLIRKRQGTVLTYNQIKENKVDFIISSRQISKYVLNQALQLTESTGPKREGKTINYDKILDYHYIIQCEKQGAQLPTQNYQLFVDKPQQQKVLPIQPRKIRHIEEQNTDGEYQQKKEETLSSTISLKKVQQVRQQVQSIKEKSKTEKKLNSGSFGYEVNKQTFACQKGSCQSKFSINQYIYEQLMKFYEIYQSQKDFGRKIAYLKAASAIKSHHKQIESERDLQKLRGIGKKIMNKVKQLLETGQIQKLQKLKQNEETLICQQLSRVWGIGSSKAKQLFYKGITSLQLLKQNQDLLNKNQKLGLKYVEQFEERIPRQKVQKMFQFVKGRLHQLVKSQNMHIVQVCGSYRRGKDTCGDIDIIITRKDGLFEEDLIIKLIKKLQQQGFLTDHLQIPSHKKSQSNSSLSYMGVCQFESDTHHRIDIKYYPLNQFAFATLYFTGSDMFNRSMRLFARKKGYSLSDHGLTRVERNGGNEKIWKGQQICLYSQKQIFEYLGLDYKSPMERNI